MRSQFRIRDATQRNLKRAFERRGHTGWQWMISASTRGRNSSPAISISGLARGIVLDFSRPVNPADNSFIESFNGKFRSEWLNTHWFLSLEGARRKMEDWRRDFNEVQPHSAIGNKAPISLLNGPSRPPTCMSLNPKIENFVAASSSALSIRHRTFSSNPDPRSQAVGRHIALSGFVILQVENGHR
jgi:transposase InsO family protein